MRFTVSEVTRALPGVLQAITRAIEAI